ncbi:DUF2919 family protein [Salmonella enterica subsp. enterica]|nr:DUF2919 family protein [Salmonella enterica subsp. enterica serovar Enteritidis]
MTERNVIPPPLRKFRYRPEDYDDEGNLKAPLWMWGGLAWFLLPWWLMVIGIVTGETPILSQTLYPTTVDAVVSLVLSLPIVMLCAIYPLRGRYIRCSLMIWGSVYMAQAVELARTVSLMMRPGGWYSDEMDLVMSCLCVDIAVLTGMLMTPRLWIVFGGMVVKR